MKNRLLILCPGQGGQHAGMFDVARTQPRASALLDRFDLPSDLMQNLASEPQLDNSLLFANRVAQPMIVAATLAMWDAIRDFAPTPQLVAGYSVGEVAAYAVAGLLTPADAVAVAGARAKLMDECLKTYPGQALVAISGPSLQRIAELIEGDLFHVAIETDADHCIAGGPAAALASVATNIAAAGGRINRLPIEIASHTPYMAPAVAPFASMLRNLNFHPARTALLSGIGACVIDGKALAIEHLARQLAEKIVWMDCMDACAEAQVTVALELGPGAALSRMLQARHPHIDSRSVADFRSIAGIHKWLARHFD